MKVPSDIEIAQSAKLRPIVDIAEKLGIGEDDLELYGKYKAKISPEVWERAVRMVLEHRKEYECFAVGHLPMLD